MNDRSGDGSGSFEVIAVNSNARALCTFDVLAEVNTESPETSN